MPPQNQVEGRTIANRANGLCTRIDTCSRTLTLHFDFVRRCDSDGRRLLACFRNFFANGTAIPKFQKNQVFAERSA